AVCIAASFALAGAAAWAGEIQQVRVEAGATGTRAEISLVGSGGYKTISLTAPNRLVVDFPDSSAVRSLKLPPAQGVVTAVRTGQPVPGTFREVFVLADQVAPFQPQMQRQGNESRLVIEWPGDAPAGTTGVATATTGQPASVPPPSVVPAASTPAAVSAEQSRSDAARATALLTAQVQQQASAGAAVSASPSADPSTATANVAAAATTAGSGPAAPSPAAILAGQATTPPVKTTIAGTLPTRTGDAASSVAGAGTPVAQAPQ